MFGTPLKFGDLRAGRGSNRAPYPAPFLWEVRYLKRNSWRPEKLRNSVSREGWNPEVLSPRMIFVPTSLPLIIKTNEVEQPPLFVCFENRRKRITYHPEMV